MPQQRKYKPKLIFTVTNDLNYDQRMIRICTSLQAAGYEVLLVGRTLKKSISLSEKTFRQKRLFCLFEKGKLFYIEYNLRLFFWLLFQKFDLVCAIDLDTIIPSYWASLIRRKKKVYDAHELFCEMKEIVTRPAIYRVWKFIEKNLVPRFKYGHTVNHPIREIFYNTYGLNYQVIMNVPSLPENNEPVKKERFILYQGAVNKGRSFETLIPAFKWIDCSFYIYGDGNFFEECKRLITENNLQEKIFLKGKLLPGELKKITPKAVMGITLFENNGLSNYYSLGNRFFDYMHAGLPQVCVNYPAYKKINDEYNVASLIDDLSPQSIAMAINTLLNNESLQLQMQANCLLARQVYNWQNEEKKLFNFYGKIFNGK
jgi:glycosyltransferase involved in cell wall biosynthesis